MAAGVEIRPLIQSDRAGWEPLFEAYLRFYDSELPKEQYDVTWARFHDDAEPMHVLGAFDDGRMVGIVHAIFHRSTWLPDTTCYLQDLYVDGSQRGRGVGEALIEKVALLARDKNAGRLYWLTQEDNATARRLYDRVAVAPGFIQYRKPL
ncbi:GNAT family N-acetyltransferase [Rhizobiales bacterium RZME27]|jgi:GNAT superfamily N-acetyltransferase|uniref:GNAT family N-acetyltransferase n=1 Tax=Endobacterium cereale TaxID=2663029 RepID=A0A6A8AKZ2_9HYPH|nr:GNAT family N-acetyltransferase [Endobacterium cereale]MEB2843739.1 GNAT family N-acetyltransferase [Endobacterium cereale]MQY49391.1 GNAT family N-acetyltransferase [Endobacterium cereale]